MCRGWRVLGRLWLVLVAAILVWSQNVAKPTPEPGVRVLGRTPPLHFNAAENLYLQLRNVGLDPSRVYRVREVSIDRAAFHITLNDGALAFTMDVGGHVTGAFFAGDAEILLSPPNYYERASMALFTGADILEERFSTAYFRFNDDTFAELMPSLVPVSDGLPFISQWNQTAHNLAEGDALRLFMTFSKDIPSAGKAIENATPLIHAEKGDDRFLHARLQGVNLGTFDLFYDSETPEQIWAGQLKTVYGVGYYDVWTSFSLTQGSGPTEAVNASLGGGGKPDAIVIPSYKIRANIHPPTELEAEAVLQLEVRQGGQRTILFELSRALRIKQVEADGHPIEFIHNQALEGSQLARHGNDLVAVVFSQPLRTGQHVELRFVYGGEVLSEAGTGLLYVGARGTWYPNRGMAMSDYDLEFHYPADWTLIATGKRVDAESSHADSDQKSGGEPAANEQVSRWVSERPIPLAGFDLGKYVEVTAHAGEVTVKTYATPVVERGFPRPHIESVVPDSPIPGMLFPPLINLPLVPSPARNAQQVGTTAAHSIEFFAQRYGPFPYSDLKLGQMPGGLSQGWPGLIFLSTISFLTTEEKSQLHVTPVENTIISQVIAHETAHQWWGDLVMWSGYRDHWMVEALANYSSLMVLESENPGQFRAVMEKLRDDLLEEDKSGTRLMDVGPVTLGTRLTCSKFPGGYDAISYGRGTWLFHMLRFMMRNAEQADRAGMRDDGRAEPEPFVRILRRIIDRYRGRSISTREFLAGFEEELPSSLWYEHHKSLDWFYEGWVNGTAIPRFELHGVKYSDKAGSTAVSGVIL